MIRPKQCQLLTWDANWDAKWDSNWDATWDANWDAIWDTICDANQCPKQHQILKRDANNAIKSAIPWKSLHFVQKMMKNTLNLIVDAKKEAKIDANHRVLLQCLIYLRMYPLQG